jgi:polar amino acid transport system substrate-binding protein
MLKKLTLFGFTSLFLLWTVSLFSQSTLNKIREHNELRVGLTGTQPPYAMIAKDSSIIGFEVDIAKKIADKMGIKFLPVEMNFSELLPALVNGEIDVIMSGMTMTTERNMEIAFVGPYHSAGMSILTFAQVFADAQSPEDLNKGSIKIAVLDGSTSEAFVKQYMPKAKVVPTANYEDAIELVDKEKVGLLLSGNAVITYTMFTHPESGYVTLDEPFNYEPIGMGVMPSDFLFVNLLQNIISEMAQNGELESLENYWFWDDEWLDQINY